MTTEPTETPTAADVRALFRWLVNVGLEAPRMYADPVTGESAIVEATEAYAQELADDRVTLAELRAAARAYIRKPMPHGGRTPWPNAGTLAVMVDEVRVSKIPTFGDIEHGVRTTMGRHYGNPAMGWDVTTVPEPAREILTRALVNARVTHRGGDDKTYVLRDLAAEYERLRKSGGAK